MSLQFLKFRPARAPVLALALACAAMAGCTTTGPQDQASSATRRSALDANIDATLSRLYAAAPDSRQLVSRAAGVLVFPSVIQVGFVVGGEHGTGALRVGGQTVGYYSTNAGSIGFQAGAQSKAVVVLFMTPDSLAKFRASNGWTVGADATVAIANIGVNGSIDTATVQQPIIGFVMTNTGLMAGVSLQGSKISRLDR